MGVTQGKQIHEVEEEIPAPAKPLRLLRQELLSKLGMTSDDQMASFIKYRFHDCSRLKEHKHHQLQMAEYTQALQASKNTKQIPQKPQLERITETNMIAVTWTSDIKDSSQDKPIFFFNETLLSSGSPEIHLSPDHTIQNIDMCCTTLPKASASENKSMIFAINDGEMQVIGAFDGHGKNGDTVARAAMCAMMKHINGNRWQFKSESLAGASDSQLHAVIRKCFKAVQRDLKKQYRTWLDATYPVKFKDAKAKKQADKELFGRKPEVSNEEKDQLCESSDWSDCSDIDEQQEDIDDADDFEVQEMQQYFQDLQQYQTKAGIIAASSPSIQEAVKATQPVTKPKFDLSTSGSSGTLVIKLTDRLVIGWVGTTRVAMHRADKQWLTHEHRPSDQSEQLRIYQHQGEVRPGLKCGRQLVYVRGRMIPGCPFTRSFGDVLAHQIGVTSEPSVAIVPIDKDDAGFTVANENVWNLVTPEDLKQMVKQSKDGVTCAQIKQMALDKYEIGKKHSIEDNKGLAIVSVKFNQ